MAHSCPEPVRQQTRRYPPTVQIHTPIIPLLDRAIPGHSGRVQFGDHENKGRSKWSLVTGSQPPMRMGVCSCALLPVRGYLVWLDRIISTFCGIETQQLLQPGSMGVHGKCGFGLDGFPYRSVPEARRLEGMLPHFSPPRHLKIDVSLSPVCRQPTRPIGLAQH